MKTLRRSVRRLTHHHHHRGLDVLTEAGSEVEELEPEEALVPLELEEVLEDQLLEDVLPLLAEKKLSAELRLSVSGESSTPSLVTSMTLA